jgi:hypothetical protein
MLDPEQATEFQAMLGAAFGAMPYPGDDRIATNPGCCDECRYTDTFFKGRTWQQVVAAKEELPTGWGGLSFLTPEAWGYYMPAYMALGLMPGIDNVAAWAVIALSPGRVGGLDEYFRERAEGFTPEQSACIRRFLEVVDPDDHITIADAWEYWSVGEPVADLIVDEGPEL